MDTLLATRPIAQIVTDLDNIEDRSAGRWCDTCKQHGSHHSDRHTEHAQYRERLTTEYRDALANSDRPLTIDERREDLIAEYDAALTAAGHPTPNHHYSHNEPRYDIDVNVNGVNAHTDSLMGAVSRALKAHNVLPADVDRFRVEMLSGTYDAALATADVWVYLRIDTDDEG